MTIRTACSSALVALNEACSGINRGDCKSAIVGGVNLILAPAMTQAMQEQGVLSVDGSCKTFSADANGYARGEAVTAIFIKPLADAVRDGNPVHAVVRATSHNVDGKTPTLSQPSTDVQEALMRRAYKVAGIDDFSATAMVECHGTGTAIGDPIEVNAVARIFGEKGVLIGSVKPNLGHTEAASGMVSLLKMVMALQHRTIPPNIKFTTPNPNIPFEKSKLTVPTEAIPWPEDRLERVSVNSFGIGGANAHVILESAASHHVPTVAHKISDSPQLLLFTANSAKSFTRLVENYKTWIEQNPDKISDLAYTLATRRTQLSHRAYAIVHNGALGNVSQRVQADTSKPKKVVMVFTGQGAQWPQMGRELLRSNDIFKSTIRSLDQHLASIDGEKPTYSIEEELKKAGKKSRVSAAEFSQPLCTAIQIALVDCFKSAGVSPQAVVGHSSGEIAAAYAAGALTAAEAITAAHHRGAVTLKQEKPGAMAAVGLSWGETEKYLISNVNIACDNSPSSVTISGDVDAVKSVVAAVQRDQPQVLARLLQVDKAYHSHHMKEIGHNYRELIGEQVAGQPSSTLFFSSVTGELADPEHRFGPRYWQDNLESPVRFREAVFAILRHDVGKDAVFLEIGPHGALAGPLRQIFTRLNSPAPYISAMARNQDCTVSYLSAIGSLHAQNVPVDLKGLFPTGSCLVGLPRYPFNHQDTYWYESRLSKEWRTRKFAHHDLLGLRVVESSDVDPAWRNLIHVTNAPWLRDHKVGENVVFPFCGYISLAGEAIRQLANASEGFAIRNIIVSTALILNEGKPTEIMSTFSSCRLTDTLDSQWWNFTVSAYNGRNWTKHCTGQVSALSEPPAENSQPEALPRKLNVRKWFEKMAKGGLNLGPAFQTLDTMTTTTSGQRAMGHVVNGRQGDEANYFIHPTALDSILQILGAAAVNGYARKTKTWLPTGIDQIKVYRCASDMKTSVSATLSSNASVVGHGSCTSEGRKVVEADGIRMSPADGAGAIEITDGHAASRCEWKPDIDFMNVSELFHTQESRTKNSAALAALGEACLRLSQSDLAEFKSDTILPHLRSHVSWIEAQTTIGSPALSVCSGGLEREALVDSIDNLLKELEATPAAPVATAIHQIYTNMDLLLSGSRLQDILPEGTLERVYEYLGNLERKDFIAQLMHSKPNLRILEIGTNQGVSLHREIIRQLTRADGEILCAEYMLTTPGYLAAEAQEKIFVNMNYATLDINEDPLEQGLEDARYDLIIAVNALRESKDAQNSLVNMRKLLQPDGRLFLQELSPSSRWVEYLLGTLPTWKSNVASGPAQSPYFDKEDLEVKLASAGFGAPEAVVLDADAPQQVTTTVISRPALETQSKKITILVEREGPKALRILSHLEQAGYDVTKCKLSDDPPSGQDVLSLLELEEPFIYEVDEANYTAFKTFLLGLQDKGAGMLFATQLVDIGCRDPRYAQVLGFARTIRTEQLAELATCQVDDFANSESIDRLLQIFTKFQARLGDDELEPDYEWAIFNDRVQVARFHPFVLGDEILVAEEPDEMATLNVHTPGRINSLHYARHKLKSLDADEVEVQVYSAGLNFRVR